MLLFLFRILHLPSLSAAEFSACLSALALSTPAAVRLWACGWVGWTAVMEPSLECTMRNFHVQPTCHCGLCRVEREVRRRRLLPTLAATEKLGPDVKTVIIRVLLFDRTPGAITSESWTG